MPTRARTRGPPRWLVLAGTIPVLLLAGDSIAVATTVEWLLNLSRLGHTGPYSLCKSVTTCATKSSKLLGVCLRTGGWKYKATAGKRQRVKVQPLGNKLFHLSGCFSK